MTCVNETNQTKARVLTLLRWIERQDWWEWNGPTAQRNIAQRARENYPDLTPELADQLALRAMQEVTS